MKRHTILSVLFLLSAYFAIGQTFTAEYYKKALWMTTRFYGAQRSGNGHNWLIADHEPTKVADNLTGNLKNFVKGQDFVKDADGSYDLTGGWFDCGDNAKFGQTEFYSGYMLSLAYSEFPDGFDDYYSQDYIGYRTAKDYSWEGGKGVPNGIPDILDELKYATDFFMKCIRDKSTFYYEVGNDGYDHAIWCTSPVKATLSRAQGGEADGSRPVQKKSGSTTSMTSLCGATLANMARCYKKFDPDYAAQCLSKAIVAYEYVTSTTKGNTACSNASIYPAKSKYEPDLVILCMELYRATGNKTYLTAAQGYSSWMASEGGYNHYYTLCYNNTEDLACYLMAVYGAGEQQVNAKKAMDFYIKLYKPSSGFILNVKHGDWGELRFPANQAFLYGLYEKHINKNGTTINPYSAGTVDYILGDNSKNFSFVVGLGNSSPEWPHHRNYYHLDNNSENNLAKVTDPLNGVKGLRQLGYMVGGKLNPGSYSDDEKSYTSSEGGIDYNAGLVGAIAYINSVKSPVDTNKFGHPTPDLGGEKTLCGTGSVTIKATVDLSNLEPGESVSYKWYNGNTLMSANNGKTSITVTAAGTYTCELTSNTGWSTKGSVDVTATLPDVSLGEDKALCKETSATFATEVEGEGISYVWAKDGKTIAGATSKSYTAYTSGTYKLTISASGCTSKSDEVIVTSQLPEVIGDTICSAGTVNLSVKTSGEYEWYNVAEEGTALASGTTYSPSITKSTTYYVQDASSINTTAGPSYNNLQGNRTYGNNYVQVTAKSAVTITEVSAVVGSVYYASAQSLTLTINNKDYKSKTVQLSNAGKYTFSFESNPIVLAAGSYKIDIKYDNAACSWFTNCDYNSFQHTDILTFSKGSEGDYAYPGLYDWKVFAGSTCARTPVFAVIDPNGDCGDTEAPTTPGTITVNNITTNSADISWVKSTDNTAVTGYDVYVNGTLYQTVTTNSLSVSDLTENTEYIVKVRAFDAAGNTSDFSSEKSFTTEKSTSTQTISLVTGWNLISFYVLPDDASVVNVLGSNISKVSIVKNNDGFYKPGKDAQLQSLTEFKFGDAYLVKATSAFNLTLEGAEATSTTISLKSGWNLLGYPKATEANASTALSSISTKYTTLKDLSSNQTKLTPGKGYYIKMNSDATITIE